MIEHFLNVQRSTETRLKAVQTFKSSGKFKGKFREQNVPEVNFGINIQIKTLKLEDLRAFLEPKEFHRPS